MKRVDLDEFVALYKPGDHPRRKPTWSDKNPDGRWRAHTYDEVAERDKCSLDPLLAQGQPPRRRSALDQISGIDVR